MFRIKIHLRGLKIGCEKCCLSGEKLIRNARRLCLMPLQEYEGCAYCRGLRYDSRVGVRDDGLYIFSACYLGTSAFWFGFEKFFSTFC
jgi:hypothetical protein